MLPSGRYPCVNCKLEFETMTGRPANHSPCGFKSPVSVSAFWTDWFKMTDLRGYGADRSR
jgi:hypothetical protein